MALDGTAVGAGARVRALVAANVGNAIEFYDWMAYALLVPYFGHQFFPNDDPTAVLLSSFAVFAVGSLARPVGAVVLGRYTDRHGRRPGLVLSVSLMVAASFGMALVPTYATIGLLAPVLLVVLRLTQGFALGPEFGGSATYLAESAPGRHRGLYASTYQSSVAVGTLAVSGLISLLEVFLDSAQMNAYGWRVVFLVGGVIAAGGLVLRRRMPETDTASRAERRRRKPLGTLWADYRGPMVRVVVICAAGLTMLYGFSSLLPSLGPTVTSISVEQAANVNTIGSFAMVLIAPLCGLLSDGVGRVWTLRIFALTGIVLVVPVLTRLDGSFGPQLMAQLLAVTLVCLWAAGALPAFPEFFPPAVRAAGVAVPYGIGAAVFGGFAPMISTSLASAQGLVGMAVFLAVMALAGGLATVRMRETGFAPLRTA